MRYVLLRSAEIEATISISPAFVPLQRMLTLVARHFALQMSEKLLEPQAGYLNAHLDIAEVVRFRLEIEPELRRT